MATETGFMVLSLAPECVSHEAPFMELVHEVSFVNVAHAVHVKKRDSAERLVKLLAQRYPGYVSVICPIVDLYKSEYSKPIHRTVNERGEIVPGTKMIETPVPIDMLVPNFHVERTVDE